jgi:hypothetical protein
VLERNRLWKNVRTREAVAGKRSERSIETKTSKYCAVLREDN